MRVIRTLPRTEQPERTVRTVTTGVINPALFYQFMIGSRPLFDQSPVHGGVASTQPTQSGSPKAGFGKAGRAWQSTTTADILSFGPATGRVGGTQWTWIVLFEKTDATVRTARMGVFGTTDRASAHLPFSDGTTYWDFGGAAGANRLTVAGLLYPVNVPQCFVLSAGPSGMRIVQNGRVVASSGTAVSRTPSAVDIGWGEAAGSDLQRLYLFAGLDQDMPLAQAIAISRNPWQLLQAVSEPQFLFDIVAAGGVIKTRNGLAWASVKSVDGLAAASVKTINGLAAN